MLGLHRFLLPVCLLRWRRSTSWILTAQPWWSLTRRVDRGPSTGARTSAWARDYICHRASPWPVGEGLRRLSATNRGRVVVTEWIDNERTTRARMRKPAPSCAARLTFARARASATRERFSRDAHASGCGSAIQPSKHFGLRIFVSVCWGAANPVRLLWGSKTGWVAIEKGVVCALSRAVKGQAKERRREQEGREREREGEREREFPFYGQA